MSKQMTRYLHPLVMLTAYLAVCATVGGCVSYSPAQLSAMSTVDLCEAREAQSFNLSAATKAAMQSELTRRNDSCASHQAAVAERRQAFLYREMYGKHDNP